MPRKKKAGFLPAFVVPIVSSILGGIGIAAAVKTLGSGLGKRNRAKPTRKRKRPRKRRKK